MVPQSDELMGVCENFIFHMTVWSGIMWWERLQTRWMEEACGCVDALCVLLSYHEQTKSSSNFILSRFNPDNAFILFWISFYFLIWLCSPIQIHVIELEFKKKINVFNSDGQNFDNVIKFINGIDLFCIDLLIFVMQSSDLLQDAKREKKVL